MKHAVPSQDEDRYTYLIRRRSRIKWLYEVQLVTRHEINALIEDNDRVVETELEDPPVRLGMRWAIWTGKRMVKRAHRRDVRQKQPWV